MPQNDDNVLGNNAAGMRDETVEDEISENKSIIDEEGAAQIEESVKDFQEKSGLSMTADECVAALKRARADYTNLRNSMEKEREGWARFATELLIEELISVLEHFEQAVAAVTHDKKDDQWMIGIMHIKKEFEGILFKHGLEKIKTAGEKFDTAYHQSVGEEKTGEEKKDTVVREVRPGYMLHGKVLRPAHVIIEK